MTSSAPPAASPAQGHAGHTAPAPEQLGGTFSFTDVEGRPVTAADFKGRWSLLFFGYSRCRASCPVAIPKIVSAAAALRKAGVRTQAVFVDIESPALGVIRRRAAPAEPAMAHMGHGDMNRIAAMRALADKFGSDLRVLTGTRGQLNAATIAFRVAREHIPPRPGEVGHSMNHSSLIYIIRPDTQVAGFQDHKTDPKDLVAAVSTLNKKPMARATKRS